MKSSEKLLIFDLNGFLCYRKKNISKFEKPIHNLNLENFDKEILNITNEDLQKENIYHLMGSLYVCFRPGTLAFLRYCQCIVDIAIFSSTTKKNVIPIIEYLNKENIYFKFVWCRDRTKPDPDYKINPNIKDYDTIKLIYDVIDSFNYYNISDVLLIDDSYNKIRFNNPKNYILVKSFVPSLYNINENFWTELIKKIKKFINKQI